MNQSRESLPVLSSILKTVDNHARWLPAYCPCPCPHRLINQVCLYMAEVFISKQSGNLSAVISPWKPFAFSRHQTNLQSPPSRPPPQPRRVRASITQSLSPQTATLQPTTCDSDRGELWLQRGRAGGEQPKPWAGQPTID